jgi:hypothetical protein
MSALDFGAGEARMISIRAQAGRRRSSARWNSAFRDDQEMADVNVAGARSGMSTVQYRDAKELSTAYSY